MRKNNFIPRNKGRRVLGPALHVFCEGATEEAYLKAYLRSHRYSRCEIEISHHTDPVNLVREAKEAKVGAPASESYWVVYDLEDISQPKKLESHKEAFQLAEKNGINIALSAVSIEVWILLHFIKNPKAFVTAKLAERSLRTYLPNYKKGNSNIFTDIQQYIPIARQNAKALQDQIERDKPNSKPFENNPYSSFHLLLDAIDKIK